MRNQLIHGGATYQSRVNRDQVRDSANLLGKLIPLIIEIMIDNPDEAWETSTTLLWTRGRMRSDAIKTF